MASYCDLKISTYPDVYGPDEDSFLLAENLNIPKGAKVLDVGTGTGILALAASKNASLVVGIDVNPKAVELAKKNAKENGIMNVRFLEGDLFSAIGKEEMFDVIIFNPPYLPAEEYDLLGKAWSGGRGGMEVIRRFLVEAPAHLTEVGVILLLLSSLNDFDEVRRRLDEAGLVCGVVAEKKFFFEQLMVVRCCFSGI
jgi:release factor glutamine methyltransferase